MSSIQMAWRNLWRHPLRSWLIMLSVAIGLAAGLFVLSVYRGMVESRMRTVIDAEVGHVQIHARGFKPDLDPARILDPSLSLLSILQNDPQVYQFGTRSLSEGMLSNPVGTAGVIVQGVDMKKESSLSQLSKKIISGRIDTSAVSRYILIGKKLADKNKCPLVPRWC